MRSLWRDGQCLLSIDFKQIRTFPHVSERLFCRNFFIIIPVFEILRLVDQHSSLVIFLSTAQCHEIVSAIFPHFWITHMLRIIFRIIAVIDCNFLRTEMNSVLALYVKSTGLPPVIDL